MSALWKIFSSASYLYFKLSLMFLYEYSPDKASFDIWTFITRWSAADQLRSDLISEILIRSDLSHLTKHYCELNQPLRSSNYNEFRTCACRYAMARVSLLWLLPFLVVCLQLISSVYGVKHADFKKCSQVSRSRGHHWFSPVSVVAIERWRTRSLLIRIMRRRILFQRIFFCETVS